MANTTNPHIDNQRRQYTRPQDFEEAIIKEIVSRGGARYEVGVDIPASVGSLAKNTIYDTAGNALGELTGTGDSSTIQEAIDTDRADGAGVVVPDPGFELDPDQVITLPADEDGFELLTKGRPTFRHPAGRGLSHIIRKPGTTSQRTGYTVGEFEIIDDDGTLDPAISISDVKESVVQRTLFFECPGVEILSDNGSFANQNLIFKPYIKGSFDGTRQAGIFLGGSDGSADQNWVFAPHYNETNFTDPDSIAYHDEGAFNNWLYTRCESADIIHLFDGCREYTVKEGGWDRTQTFRRTIEERGKARGSIEYKSGGRYEAMEIHAPHTRIRGRGRYVDRTNPTGRPVDVLESLERVTGARTLESMGLRDASSGGSVVVGPVFSDHPKLDFSTGASTGNTAVLDLGDPSTDPSLKAGNALPKGAYSFGGDTTDVLVRTGFFVDSNNYAELIYDPNNTMGNHSTGNWYLEVVDGGVEQGSVSLGVSPTATPDGEEQIMSLCCLKTGSAGPGSVTAGWVESMASSETINSIASGQGTWRWYVETLANTDKSWAIRPRDNHRLYRM